MPPQRTPLRSIDGNYNDRGPDLTPYQREHITCLRDGGLSPQEIELQEKHSRAAVRSTFNLHDADTNGVSQPRPSCPTYGIRDKHTMRRHLRKYPKSSFQQASRGYWSQKEQHYD
jgi:hypothetical protein